MPKTQQYSSAAVLHLCPRIAHWHTTCCNKPVSDACAGRSSWQMLDPGSLAVTHSAHILAHTLWESQNTAGVGGVAEFTTPQHLSFSLTAVPSRSPASPLCCRLFSCFVSSSDWWNPPVFAVEFLWFVVVQFYCLHQSKTPDDTTDLEECGSSYDVCLHRCKLRPSVNTLSKGSITRSVLQKLTCRSCLDWLVTMVIQG